MKKNAVFLVQHAIEADTDAATAAQLMIPRYNLWFSAFFCSSSSSLLFDIKKRNIMWQDYFTKKKKKIKKK